MKYSLARYSICLLAMVAPLCAYGESAAPGDTQLQSDWLRQEELRFSVADAGAKVTPAEDARGGCDGVINGEWGFHTALEDNPWWQVDLGEAVSVGRIAIYNRESFAQRTARMEIFFSEDGRDFRSVYVHDGSAFRGFSDKKPLVVEMRGERARYVKLCLPGNNYFHLDEVEIYGTSGAKNLALGKAATQSSVSQWSVRKTPVASLRLTSLSDHIKRGLRLAEKLSEMGVDTSGAVTKLARCEKQRKALTQDSTEEERNALLFDIRSTVRDLAFSNPLLDFDRLLFAKRAPGMLPHVSDQYYGWWSRPGGGLYVMEGFNSPAPRLRNLTADMPEGNFVRPELSYDGDKLLFAYCHYYPEVHKMEKVDKDQLPEDSFYQVYEMGIDGNGRRQLTRGRYDDFDARYLPNGDIIFLSTRKGVFLRADRDGAQSTLFATQPDSYVRCGGDNKRPCAVFTLHTMDNSGGNLRPISAFENFEWTPAIGHDGRIIYARWDYIDRFNGHFMSLWSTNPDGTNSQLVYGNYTTSPQCIFEARPIPNSRKLVFTGTAHHSVTGGSLALFDRSKGMEGEEPLTRLTPEVRFPEAEGWPEMYYSNPWPLSEDFFLVAWSDRRLPPHRGGSPVQAEADNPTNAAGLYLYDAFGNLDLIYRDPKISSHYPIPIKTRKKPPVLPDGVDWGGPKEGVFLVQDVGRGLGNLAAGKIKRLRIIGVTPKVQPFMNNPVLGVSKEETGKFILGTVPVEPDGSACFLAPSGIPFFFQALDTDGAAVQTMRSLTYLQPGQTLSCVGCHESRDSAPGYGARPIATRREPSRIKPGPDGTWPLRFDRLVQPVLNASCVKCHAPGSDNEGAAKLDLRGEVAWGNLLEYAGKDLHNLVFERDRSMVGESPSRDSKLMAALKKHEELKRVRLSDEDIGRFAVWMDVYAQKQGAFSPEQEQELEDLRREMVLTLDERK